MAHELSGCETDVDDGNAVEDPFPSVVLGHLKRQRQAQFDGMGEKTNGIREME